MFLFGQLQENYQLSEISLLIWICSLSTSTSSSVWLNFYYYTQVVPAQTALFIWIKKNIKSIICCLWLFEIFSSAFDFTVRYLCRNWFELRFSNNFTMDHDMTVKWQKHLCFSLDGMLIAHNIFCLCVMLVSSGSTVAYLCRHMRHMAANGQHFSSPRFSGQVRVTVTGIIQGILYAFCSVWNVCSFTSFHSSLLIQLTVIDLYISGTTFNLGVGQTVFRQRAADIWLRGAQRCNSLNKEDDTEAQTRRPG
ncbi:taste receptor, type 2, member 201, tandem duplicate 1 [Pempheris klunzingeri]|uniref:taste receptor, type 2, member 201, tandem duplicate 1 n=1 Tax=Pempheris klunzingeri TaxID=3127111 RepID=UPI003980B20A